MKKKNAAVDQTESFETGRYLRVAGRLAEAQTAFEDASRRAPGRVDIALHLAETLLQRNKIDAHFQTLEKARAAAPPNAPNDVPGWVRGYKLEVALMNFKKAAEIGETILDLTRDLRVIEALAWPVLIDDVPTLSRPSALRDRMASALERFISDDPRTPWGNYFRLYLLDRMRDRHPTVIVDIKRLHEFPAARYGWMLYEPAMYHLHTLNFKEAVADYQAAADASDPPQWRALYRLAEAHFCLGDIPSARRALAQARKMSSGIDLAHAHAYAAWLGLMSGDYEQAKKDSASAARLGARSYPRHVPGALQLQMGRLQESLKTLEALLAGEPENEQILLWHAEALLKAGRFKPAREEASLAVKLEKGRNFYALILRALANAGLGDWSAFERDHQAVPPEVLSYAENKLSARPEDARVRARKTLEKVLELSRGIRKDGYLRSAWMR